MLILLSFFIAIQVTVSIPIVRQQNVFKENLYLIEEERSLIENDGIFVKDKLLPKTKELFQEKKLQKRSPPIPKYKGRFGRNYNVTEIAAKINSWKSGNNDNIWEYSGLLEGDIMLEPDIERNVILNTSLKWADGVVPYYINDDFNETQKDIIKKALEEINSKTCVVFRPYEETDKDYVLVQGRNPGCWSFVGRHTGGQILNLQTPNCVTHGVVIHEFMHVAGFHHQQSSPDRDKYVIIHWENIMEEHKKNFYKYDNKTVTTYNIGYDYNSIMHYGSHAFTKNAEETITPKVSNVTIGQRRGLSDKDISKLKILYMTECGNKNFKGNIIEDK